ncbi:MAG: PP2C family protein-serine/threonine phosphatase [Planctomycetota bacterium]
MSALFRRRRPPEPDPEPIELPEHLRNLPDQLASDASATMYVAGDAQQANRRIRMLVNSLREVSSTTDPAELLSTMVDRAVGLVGAERGLLFTIEDDGRPKLRVSRDAEGNDLPSEIRFSHNVVESVMRTGKAIHEKTDVDLSQSMVDLNIESVMCVPLGAAEERLGVLYVDTRSGERAFDKSTLRFFEAFADMLAILWNTRRAMEAKLEQQRMQQDLELARTIQMDLVPEKPLHVEGYSMCGRVMPASETGGDYFDFFFTRDGHIAMALGDVTGHGIGAALIMAAARAYLRASCQNENCPATILGRVNQSLSADIADGLFMSMFLMVLDPETGEFVYGNAGQTSPVLLKGGAGETEEFEITGMALAVDEEIGYDKRGPFKLEAGDTVVMFSDGLTELRQGEDMYGPERVIESIKRHASGTAEELMEGVFADALAWAEGADEALDDLTVAVMRADP